MSDPAPPGSQETRGHGAARELEEHLRALDTFTPLALGILATAAMKLSAPSSTRSDETPR